MAFIHILSYSHSSEAIPKHYLTLNKLNMKWECSSPSSAVDSTGVRQGIFTQDKNYAYQKLMYKKCPQHVIRLAVCRSLLYVNQINTKYSVGIIFRNDCFFYLKLRFKWDLFLFLAILRISVYNNFCLWSAFKLFSRVIVQWSLGSEKKQKKEYVFPDSLTLCSASVKGHTITESWPRKQMYTHRDIYMYELNGTPKI